MEGESLTFNWLSRLKRAQKERAQKERVQKESGLKKISNGIRQPWLLTKDQPLLPPPNRPPQTKTDGEDTIPHEVRQPIPKAHEADPIYKKGRGGHQSA